MFGGQSSEHDISKMSASTIISSMNQDKYFVMPVYITRDGRWMLYDGPVENIKNGSWEKYATSAILSPDTEHKGLLRIVGDKVKKIAIDVVFPVLHGKGGEDGTIQGLLELAKLPYVGCGVLASSVSMNKAFTKIVVDTIGVEQARHIVMHKFNLEDKLEQYMDMAESKCGYPMFVKPANAGSSVGVSKAENREELKKSIALAFEEDSTIIIEETIVGRELECAVMGNDEVKASAVGEILAAADFYDFEAKYVNKESKTVVPASIDKEKSEEIRQKAIKIFKALDGKGLSRVDFFLEEGTGRVVFNEINTLPGFTAISMYPMLFNEAGMTTEEIVDKLIDLAFDREMLLN